MDSSVRTWMGKGYQLTAKHYVQGILNINNYRQILCTKYSKYK